MSSSMEFWATCVKPGKPVKVNIDDGMTLRLTQCSLGETVKPGRSVLKVKAAGKNCVLCSLMADKIESSVLELMFEEGEVEFSVVGPNEIHLAGNMLDNDDADDMNMMGGDEDESDEEEDDEEEDESPSAAKSGKKAAMKAAIAAAAMDEDEDDEIDEEDDEEEDDEEEDDEEEDEEEEDDDEEEEEEEEEEEVGQKRSAPKQAPQSAGKQQKTPAKATPGKDAGSATKSSPMTSPRREVPGDMKAKVKKVMAGHATGIKGSDFPREWEKVHGKGFKDVYAKCGFKKMAEFLKACDDVIRVDEKGGGNITYFPKGK